MFPFCSLYNFQIPNLSVYENLIPLEVVLTCSETSEEASGSSIVCCGKWTMMLNESLGILVLQCFAHLPSCAVLPVPPKEGQVQ